jgi:hypothetical protein
MEKMKEMPNILDEPVHKVMRSFRKLIRLDDKISTILQMGAHVYLVFEVGKVHGILDAEIFSQLYDTATINTVRDVNLCTDCVVVGTQEPLFDVITKMRKKKTGYAIVWDKDNFPSGYIDTQRLMEIQTEGNHQPAIVCAYIFENRDHHQLPRLQIHTTEHRVPRIEVVDRSKITFGIQSTNLKLSPREGNGFNYIGFSTELLPDYQWVSMDDRILDEPEFNAIYTDIMDACAEYERLILDLFPRA